MSKFVGEFLRVESRHSPGDGLRPGERNPTIDEIAAASIEAFDIFGGTIDEILQRREGKTGD